MMSLRTASCLALLAAFACGCDAAPPPPVEETPPEIATNLERLPGILADISPDAEVVLYEGLPSGFWEPARREEALRKPTIERYGYRLYDKPLPLVENDRDELTAIFRSQNSFAPLRQGKECGGFFPEYSLEWTAGGKTTVALISLECGEAKLHSERGELYCDLSAAAATKLKKLLSRYVR